MNEMKKRSEFFLERRTLIHVKAKTAFYNGYILEVHKDKIIIEDRFFGKLPLYFTEIIKIEPYKVKREVRE